MSILSIIALPAALIEYYFTKERITARTSPSCSNVSLWQQTRACFSDRCWCMMIIHILLLHLLSGLTGGSIVFYSNWVLGNSIESGAAQQILLNAVGQFPLGIGIAALWPLVHRFGKQRVSSIGF